MMVLRFPNLGGTGSNPVGDTKIPPFCCQMRSLINLMVMNVSCWPEPSIRVAEICTNPIAAYRSGPAPRLLWWRIGGIGQKETFTSGEKRSCSICGQTGMLQCNFSLIS